jgi:hypothetical protein
MIVSRTYSVMRLLDGRNVFGVGAACTDILTLHGFGDLVYIHKN